MDTVSVFIAGVNSFKWTRGTGLSLVYCLNSMRRCRRRDGDRLWMFIPQVDGQVRSSRMHHLHPDSPLTISVCSDPL